MRTIKEIELNIETINQNIESYTFKLKERGNLIKYHHGISIEYKEELERLHCQLDESEELLYNLKN